MANLGEPAQDLFHKHLRRRGLKLTRQRATILRVFLATEQHLDIHALHALVQAVDPQIGFSTVYRTMKLFLEAKIAQARHFENEPVRFERIAPDEHHDHLICILCGRIIEFENETIERLQAEVASAHGFDLISHRYELYGHCPGCRGAAAPRKDEGRRFEGG